MKLLRLPALLLVMVVGAAGAACTDQAGSSVAARSPSSAAASSARTAASSDVPPPPRVGQCRNTPAGNLGPGDWVDQTPVVDCSKKHTLETFAVIKPVEKLTLATAKELAASCESPAVDYLGINSREIRRLDDQVVYWPSRAQRAAGQNWLRCDVGVQATTGCCGPLAPQKGSLRGDVGSDPARFYVCINQLPDPGSEQPLTSCQKPHRAEILPSGLPWDVTRYPSAAALSKKGRAGCHRLVSERQDRRSLVVTPEWQSRANWSGGTLYGWCWIHRSTGSLPPIR